MMVNVVKLPHGPHAGARKLGKGDARDGGDTLRRHIQLELAPGSQGTIHWPKRAMYGRCYAAQFWVAILDHGVVNQIEEGDRIAIALGNRKAAILRNHGLLTVGQSVDEAVWWFLSMDRCCHAQLLAEAAGKPVNISHENALLAWKQIGTHIGGWFQFQPLWNLIAREQPDLFD